MAIEGPVALTRAALRDHVDTLDDYADTHVSYGAFSSSNLHKRRQQQQQQQQQQQLPIHHLHPQSSQVQSQVRSHAHRYYSSNQNQNNPAASSVAPPAHKWGALSTTGRTPGERAESLRARWDLEWHRGMLELHRLGISDALSMSDLLATPLRLETNDLERAYGERADAALVHPWRPANFARYMQDVACSFHLLRGPTGTNPITGVAHSEWRDRLAHLDRLLPRVRSLPCVSWNQAEFDAGQEKWRSARRWDEDTELDFGDNASMTSAQASAWMRFQATCEETHLVDPRAAFEALKERLAWARTVPRQHEDIPSMDAAVAPLLQAHHSATASAVKSPQPSRISRPNDGVTAATPTPASPAVEQPKNPAAVDGLFNGSVSSLGRSVSIPARSDIVDDVFGPHPDDHHTPMPFRAGDNAFLPPLTDGVLTTDPRTHSRKVATIAPAHRVVESFTEVSAYLASATYVASLCGPPLRDMAYGVIIVPAGEESLLLGNWREHQDDADDDAVREFKHEVLEKSRVIKEEERRRERKANIQAKEEAKARQEEDKAESKRLEALKKKALMEQRPITPTGRDVYVASKSEDLFQATTAKKVRRAERAERAAERAAARAIRETEEPRTPPKHETDTDRHHADRHHHTDADDADDDADADVDEPLTPPRRDSKMQDDTVKSPSAAVRLSGEGRPSLSLFPRNSTSLRDGGTRSPLVNRFGEVMPQSPITVQPRRPSIVQPTHHEFSHSSMSRRHSDHRGRKDSIDGIAIVRTDRSPRRRHLARLGTTNSMPMSGSYDANGGFRGRIKRLKGRMGLV